MRTPQHDDELASSELDAVAGGRKSYVKAARRFSVDNPSGPVPSPPPAEPIPLDPPPPKPDKPTPPIRI
jgi:hypothetical protein